MKLTLVDSQEREPEKFVVDSAAIDVADEKEERTPSETTFSPLFIQTCKLTCGIQTMPSLLRCICWCCC